MSCKVLATFVNTVLYLEIYFLSDIKSELCEWTYDKVKKIDLLCFNKNCERLYIIPIVHILEYLNFVLNVICYILDLTL